MTETLYRCNFCGVLDIEQPIKSMDFMGENEDYHICGKCVNVVSNIIYEVSQIAMCNPSDTTRNGREGCANIIRGLGESTLYKSNPKNL